MLPHIDEDVAASCHMLNTGLWRMCLKRLVLAAVPHRRDALENCQVRHSFPEFSWEESAAEQ